MSLKSCNIIYGYLDNCLDKYQDSPVLLIEPRSDIIDILKKDLKDITKNKNIILISKMLLEKDLMTESILYFNKEENKYFTNNEKLLVMGTNYFNVKKYKVFTTSINNIILQYNIQNINSISININVQNCNKILDSIIPFNHIISNIIISDTVKMFSDNCKLLENFYKKENLTFTHKNLNIKLPNIGMYINCNGKIKNNKEISLLVQQYKMNLIIMRKNNSFIIPYPESITIINNVYDAHSKIYHENIIRNFECIFNKDQNIKEQITVTNNQNEQVNENINEQINETNNHNNQNEQINETNKIDVGDLDIIMQFNPKYFDNNKTLQIMYPLKDNIIYINKVFDIIYGTKNCIYMLYQILKSKYFSDFLEVKKIAKPKLFTIFSKMYFFEYISKIFVIKEF